MQANPREKIVENALTKYTQVEVRRHIQERKKTVGISACLKVNFIMPSHVFMYINIYIFSGCRQLVCVQCA